MNNNECPEFKVGDVVEHKRLCCKGVVISCEGSFCSVNILESLPVEMMEIGDTTYHFDPVTFVKRIDAHVGLLKLVKEGGKNEH